MAMKARNLAVIGILFFSSSIIGTSSDITRKVCQGTSNGLSYTKGSSPRQRWTQFMNRYKDCVYVDGNLEIVNFEDHEFDNVSFLHSIEEVTGYVLVVSTYARRIQLNNLRIIRGRTLHNAFDYPKPANQTRNYSLYVAYNYRDTEGLTQLVMPKLTEISAGSVMFYSNARLCFVDTIDWTDILSGEGAKVIFVPPVTDYNRTHCNKCPIECKIDDEEKDTKHCWNRKHCQNFTRILCAKQCSGRCFGKNANQCCHVECAAGCRGPSATDCHSCKNFVDNGSCVSFCPPSETYNQELKKFEKNQNVKYTYGSQCVKECPKHMMVRQGACVSDCGINNYANEKGLCIECKDEHCPMSCLGTGDDDWVHADNIRRFAGCTSVQGSLKIQGTTFTGDENRNIPGLTVDDLSVLNSIVEITDYLRIDADHEELRNLSFLSNLKVIHGRKLDKGVSAVRIIFTHLERLDLDSLREVRHGQILVRLNPRLCFANSFNWSRLLFHSEGNQEVIIQKNRNESECEKAGLVCSPQCTSDGCMGPLDNQCFECSNHRFRSKCISSCADHSSPHLTPINGTSRECTPCHENCLNSCTGTGDDQCAACKYRKDESRCVLDCPAPKYADATGVCLPCSPNCAAEGCNGPDNAISPTGCKTCEHVIFWKDNKVPECLSNDTECPQDYYKHASQTLYSKQRVCLNCHDECLRCAEFGADKCHQCRNFEQDGICVASCSADHYADGKRCVRCQGECLDCYGPTVADCKSCRVYTLYLDFERRTTTSKFNCTNVCPEFAPNRQLEGNQNICTPEYKDGPDEKKLVAIIAGTICGGVFFLGFLVVVILILRRQVARAEEKKLSITAKMSGIVECEPLTPSNAKPDMAVLRLIKESDIRRSGIIGSGAFGTVYKGLWVPEGENVKIPVAIKVLQEGAGENANILEEARIMASVVHPSCLHVLAVCLTAQVMLITQLMPLGCLLDYVRKHRDNIGSKAILNWCTQIARGMSYLEERGIIHRDLAARNVLVHSPNHVKITDFGLAKLVNEDGQFLSTGGKLPIKWLALECIRNRVFTHKSDVWSFGVTVWELCTYGQRPYENVNASDIVNLLEKGERLPQPSICTIDVYMIMIKCWMLGAESRPSFAELAEEFAKMARDPGRYIVISNDKLMRLPSQPADFHELMRNVSLTLDGPEEVIMADEYVNEHSKKHRFRRLDKMYRDGSQTPTIGEEDGRPSQNMEPVETAEGSKDVIAKSPDPKSPGSRFRLVPRLELASQNRLSGAAYGDEGSRESPRYSPDPSSLSYHSAFPVTVEDGVDGATPTPSADKKKVTATESMRLALDGSDYLQPKSSSLNPASYLELVDYNGTDELLPEGAINDSEKEQSSLMLKAPSAIENPEYFQPTNTTPLLVGQVR